MFAISSFESEGILFADVGILRGLHQSTRFFLEAIGAVFRELQCKQDYVMQRRHRSSHEAVYLLFKRL